LGAADPAYRFPQAEYLSIGRHVHYPSGGSQYIEAINSYLSDSSCMRPLPVRSGRWVFEKFMTLGIREEHIDKVLYLNAEKLLKLRE